MPENPEQIEPQEAITTIGGTDADETEDEEEEESDDEDEEKEEVLQ